MCDGTALEGKRDYAYDVQFSYSTSVFGESRSYKSHQGRENRETNYISRPPSARRMNCCVEEIESLASDDGGLYTKWVYSYVFSTLPRAFAFADVQMLDGLAVACRNDVQNLEAHQPSPHLSVFAMGRKNASLRRCIEARLHLLR